MRWWLPPWYVGRVAGFENDGVWYILGRDMATRGTNGAVLVRRLVEGPAVASAVCAIADGREPFVLERTGPGTSGGRYSILGYDPIDQFWVRRGHVSGWLDRFAERVGPADEGLRAAGVPLVGGWVGFAGYEAGVALGATACTMLGDLALPIVWFGLYDTVAVFDHLENVWRLVAADVPGCVERGSKSDRLDRLERMLRGGSGLRPVDWSRGIADEPVASMSRASYFDRVARAKAYIAAGEIYQMNLTQRFTARTDASALEVYRRLRVANPGAYSALLMCGGSAVLSSSPELFIELRDGVITTRPIKGTRPRTGEAVMDAVRRRELARSEKDGAELAMIVDLSRNDLGRVCAFGSVRVERAADLETHPTVYHLVATVTGRLRDELCWADVLRASFPGGSITGCPKIRAMEIINELETTERSVYCGSIGYIGLDGSMCLNIAIRTMVLDRGDLHLFGGGAIVADSDAAEEYEEMLAKTAGMMRALRARDPAASDDGTWERSA